MPQTMHFTVIGAGAVGGGVGAHLVRAGYPVLFVDSSPEHVDAINATGLRLEGVREFAAHAPAVLPDGLERALGGRTPEVILLAVKAQHTVSALEPVARLMGEGSYVVSLQNGLNERAIAARIGASRTIGSFVNFGGDYLDPGRLLFSGTHGEFFLGELDGRMTPRLEALGTLFRETFLDHTQTTPNIWGYLWGKLGYVAMVCATAATDETQADVMADARYRPMLANLAGEIVRVSDAEGIRCEGFAGYDPDVMRFTTPRDWDGINRVIDHRVAVNRKSLKPRSGVWRDLAVRHRPTEIDEHMGAVVAIGRTHGLALPLNERLIAIIHDLEQGRRERGLPNLDDLAALNATTYPADGAAVR